MPVDRARKDVQRRGQRGRVLCLVFVRNVTIGGVVGGGIQTWLSPLSIWEHEIPSPAKLIPRPAGGEETNG